MPGTIDGLSGAFRENVRFFLQEFAVLEDYTVAGMPLWSTWFITASNGGVFPLYTIEETVQHSPEPFCDHCKFAGIRSLACFVLSFFSSVLNLVFGFPKFFC